MQNKSKSKTYCINHLKLCMDISQYGSPRCIVIVSFFIILILSLRFLCLRIVRITSDRIISGGLCITKPKTGRGKKKLSDEVTDININRKQYLSLRNNGYVNRHLTYQNNFMLINPRVPRRHRYINL